MSSAFLEKIGCPKKIKNMIIGKLNSGIKNIGPAITYMTNMNRNENGRSIKVAIVAVFKNSLYISKSLITDAKAPMDRRSVLLDSSTYRSKIVSVNDNSELTLAFSIILSFAFFNITSNNTAIRTPIAKEFNEETDSFGNIRSYTTKMNKDVDKPSIFEKAAANATHKN